MSEALRAVTAIATLLALILFALLLKRRGFLEESHGRMISRLVANVTLPAIVLVTLSRSRILWNELGLAMVMLAAGVACLALGWGIARGLRLNRPQTGAVILSTGFANASMLGFTIIAQMFPGDREDLAEAVMLSGIGSQPLIFLLGTLIAIHYGGSEVSVAERRRASLRYFRSPIFFALILGLTLSVVIRPDTKPFVARLMNAIKVVGDANTFLVTLAVGLLLQLRLPGPMLRVAALVAAGKLVVMPLLAWFLGRFLHPNAWQLQVLVLEAGMPSAMLAVTLCSAYHCDDRLAASLVFLSTVLSLVTLPLLFLLV
ncbi:MAG: AEC family transporter [Verrucomicrobiales bacterium]|nr:AEC family transporter [Verrucomicrobiales bacterium]